MDELEFAQQFAPSGPVTIHDIFRRQAAPDWEEIEEARRERAAADAEAERRENMALANRQFGDPLGNLTRSQQVAAEARERVQALEDQLAEARKVLHRCAEEYIGWQERAEMVTATAQRSAPVDLLAEAKRALTDAQVRAMAAARPERPPFARGGHAVRSEVTCEQCRKCGFTPEQSFEVHHSDADGNPLAVEQVSEDAEAERRGYGYAEVSR